MRAVPQCLYRVRGNPKERLRTVGLGHMRDEGRVGVAHGAQPHEFLLDGLHACEVKCHVSELVLDGLELADQSTEPVSKFGVVHGRALELLRGKRHRSLPDSNSAGHRGPTASRREE